MEFKYRTAIVTGSSRGIGFEIAKEFLQSGGNVSFVDIKPTPSIMDEYIKSGRAIYVRTDLANPDEIKKMVEKTKQVFGRIDFMINNAAISAGFKLRELPLEKWQNVIDVNLTAPMLCAKYCYDELVKSNGAIVNIASTRALMSEADTEAYSASKAGLVGLTHAMAVSFSGKIRVNSISPGWIDVRREPDDMEHPEPFSKEDHLQHPAGRVGKAEDIAAMALYLCSERAGFITGQNFVIDGGMTKKMIYV